jgi:hypothetical protein
MARIQDLDAGLRNLGASDHADWGVSAVTCLNMICGARIAGNRAVAR